MMPLLDSLLVVVVLLNFFALGTSRIRTLVQIVAIQGMVLGTMPMLIHQHFAMSAVLIGLATIALKGAVIPGMLRRALRDLPIRREVEPYVGLITSMVLGAVGTGLAIAFASKLPLLPGHTASLFVPAALSTALTGFLILTTRMKAITQAIGYLILENGIFIFGLTLIEALPVMVELGVLLDLVVGIFVMGIIIGHINREFASESADELAALKD